MECERAWLAVLVLVAACHTSQGADTVVTGRRAWPRTPPEAQRDGGAVRASARGVSPTNVSAPSTSMPKAASDAGARSPAVAPVVVEPATPERVPEGSGCIREGSSELDRIAAEARERMLAAFETALRARELSLQVLPARQIRLHKGLRHGAGGRSSHPMGKAVHATVEGVTGA